MYFLYCWKCFLFLDIACHCLCGAFYTGFVMFLCGSVDLEFDTKYTSSDLGPSSFSTGVLGVLSKMFDRSCVHVLVNN